MSKKFNILHISQTPLVGAASKISVAQRMIGHNAYALALNDYPGDLTGFFISDYLRDDKFCQPLIDSVIANADIIHIHNDIPDNWITRLVLLNQRAKFYYQVHSPLREGPLYISRDKWMEIPFAGKFVVGQYQPRLYPDFTIVPNIILDPPSLNLRKEGEKLKIIFSPTHLRSGRWNNKSVKELDIAIQSLVNLNKIDVYIPEKAVHPKILMTARRLCHVTIDEIATGAFHQVSLEGLAAGNVVINRADYFSKAVFSRFTNGEQPPFLYSDKSRIIDTLTNLANDVALTNKYQLESYDYFNKFLSPLKMAKVFDDAYGLFQGS